MSKVNGVAGQMTRAFLLMILTALLSECASVPPSPVPDVTAQGPESPMTSARASRFADSVLRLMSLDEKLGQLAQSPGRGTQTGPRVAEGGEQLIRAGRVGSFLGIFGAEYTRELQRIATQESRLKIPLLFANDVVHGFRTIFPVPIAEAASFDPERVT
jgi:beta-glucosidase